MVALDANIYILLATASPIEAVAHREAAVVRPLILPLSLNITPAPKKPIPLTIWAAILEGSETNIDEFGSEGFKTLNEIKPNKQEPIATAAWVRIPASPTCLSLSRPIKAPKKAANKICKDNCNSN